MRLEEALSQTIQATPHEAEGDQLDPGERALLGQQLAELRLGAAIEDHPDPNQGLGELT